MSLLTSARTVLNAAPAPAEPLDPSLLHLVDILVVNQTEAELLAGEGAGQVGSRLTHLVPRYGYRSLEWRSYILSGCCL